MIDCHILVSSSTPKEQVDRCIDSVQAAIAACAYPVELHILPGQEGNIGQARRTGFGMGTNKYVTYVDDDDYVDVDIFSSIPIDTDADGYSTGERIIHDGKVLAEAVDRRHHLAVFKRSLVDASKYYILPYLSEVYLMETIKTEHISKALYNYCSYSENYNKHQARLLSPERKRSRILLSTMLGDKFNSRGCPTC